MQSQHAIHTSRGHCRQAGAVAQAPTRVTVKPPVPHAAQQRTARTARFASCISAHPLGSTTCEGSGCACSRMPWEPATMIIARIETMATRLLARSKGTRPTRSTSSTATNAPARGPVAGVHACMLVGGDGYALLPMRCQVHGRMRPPMCMLHAHIGHGLIACAEAGQRTYFTVKCIRRSCPQLATCLFHPYKLACSCTHQQQMRRRV